MTKFEWRMANETIYIRHLEFEFRHFSFSSATLPCKEQIEGIT